MTHDEWRENNLKTVIDEADEAEDTIEKYLLHANRLGVYMNEYYFMIKGGYSMEFLGSNGKK